MRRNGSKNRIRSWAFGFAAPLAALVFCGGDSALAAPAETVLYSFCKRLNCTDGSGPVAGLIADSTGNLYGTTYSGGGSNLGVIFKLSPTGTYTRLHSFKGSDGAEPGAGLYADAKGNLYGTTETGGVSDIGVIFKRSPSGTFKVLHSFSGGDGSVPIATLIADSSGNLYGTTYGGGAWHCRAYTYCGTVFKLSPTGSFTLLHSLNFSEGWGPSAGVIADSNGNLYGTAYLGGTGCAYGCGTVFKLSPSGTLTVLHNFNLSDGWNPLAGLIANSSGNLYGTTRSGGAANNGVVFKLAPDGTETVLYSFCSLANCADGGSPQADLIADREGNLYGTTAEGGASSGCGGFGCGVVFKLSQNGTVTRTETVLYSFCSLANCADGAGPQAGLRADREGNLYGTTAYGGAHGSASTGGTVFKLTGTGFVP